MQALYSKIRRAGQKKLFQSKVVIVGIGALGSVCAELLVRSGVGNIILIDRDYVELDNLHRQILYSENDIGKLKAKVAKKKLRNINSEVNITAISRDLNYENINELIGLPDLILGGTDNMESRFLINDYALKNKLTWISGAAAEEKGMVLNIIAGGPCFQCVFSNSGLTCDRGILNSTSTFIASIMISEAIKLLLNNNPERHLLHINLANNEITKIKIKKHKGCMSCKGNYLYLKSKPELIKLCGKGVYQIRIRSDSLKKNILKLKHKKFEGVIHTKHITYFDDGRVFIKAENKKTAQQILSRFL